jgi:iron(III) transport system substrate-binding protein
MRRLTRPVTLAAAAAAVAALAAGCGSGGGGKPSLTLYNGQHLELTRALIAAFERQTGIDVHLRSNDGVVLADQILQEGGHSPADVYLTENSPELMNLEEHGLLAGVPKDVSRQVPARYSSPKKQWLPVALRVSSLVYDPRKLTGSQLPASIFDLAKPEWRGRVAVSPLDSDFPPIVGAIIAARGEKAAAAWLAGLKRNAKVYQDEEAVAAAVDRGDVATGIVNQYYWYRLRLEQGANHTRSRVYYFPSGDPGSVVNVSGAAALASSKHAGEAERFLAFLVSPAAQRIIAEGDDYEYPARPGIAPNAALPPLANVAHTSFGVKQLGDDRPAAKLIAAAGFGS